MSDDQPEGQMCLRSVFLRRLESQLLLKNEYWLRECVSEY